MKNKFKYGELVKVSGIGKMNGKVKKLGFIIEKDSDYNEYFIDLIFGNKDWFEESDITRVFSKTKKPLEKYQIKLCTTIKGYELIKEKLESKKIINNNKLKNVKVYKRFRRENQEYIIAGWNSVYWPVSNKSVKIIENTIKSFRQLKIPFKYIVINEEQVADIKILEFTEMDKNVDILSIERKIKIKNSNYRIGRKK